MKSVKKIDEQLGAASSAQIPSKTHNPAVEVGDLGEKDGGEGNNDDKDDDDDEYVFDLSGGVGGISDSLDEDGSVIDVDAEDLKLDNGKTRAGVRLNTQKIITANWQIY